jgi:protein phosphatase inhibitor 2
MPGMSSIHIKPALVNSSNDSASNKETRRLKRATKELQWDEAAIEEHNQLRGTRMKIDEPNTPYTHYDSGSETDGSCGNPKSPTHQQQAANSHTAISWDHLERKLDSVAAVRDQYPSSPSQSSHDGTMESVEADERKKELVDLEFKEHRKRHYNEMELVRQYRQEHPDTDDLVEDLDGDADDENDNEN